MFEKILVYENAIAKNHPALQRAIQLARGNDVELKIVDIVESAENVSHDRHRKMRSVVELEREDRLDIICHPLHDLEIRHSTELLRGRPFARICQGSRPRRFRSGHQDGIIRIT